MAMKKRYSFPVTDKICPLPSGSDPNLERRSHGSYSINGTLELMARNPRNSINSLSRDSNLSTMSLISQKTNHICNETNWSWKYLRDQFHEQELETQCKRYTQRLRGGFFAVFLVLNMFLFFAHMVILVISTENQENSNMKRISSDIVFYIFASLLPIIFLGIRDKYNKKLKWLYPLASCFIVIILVLFDLSVSIFHNSFKFGLAYPALRPAHVEHVLLGCYIFLPVDDNFQATVLGGTTTLTYFLCLWFVTYRLNNDIYIRLAADFVYLLCINSLGLYLRLVNEIIVRRMFLDARKCVETTMRLNFQKNKEERLMLSIIPPHVKRRIKDDIETMYHLMNSGKGDNFDNIKPFDDLYIEEHSDVTILYADIVNYTKMTSTVPVKKLVNILNELFGKFDDASEKRKVVRIKFLGDCYYCVAGIPQVGDTTAHLNHAKKSIDFGLDMISIIKEVRENHELDIDMRIGVHSGRILCGLIGSHKWQYDIWSRDVVIANKMEQTGRAGKIHLTNHTLSKINDDDYFCERAYAETNDPFLAQNRITTYLLSQKTDEVNIHSERMPPIKTPVSHPSVAPTLYDKRTSINATNHITRLSNRPKNSIQSRKLSRDEDHTIFPISNRRSLFMDDTNREYLEMLTLVDNTMAEEIEKLPLGKFEQWYRNSFINPLFLIFHNYKWELSYCRQPDPLYKLYILSVNCVFFCIFLIQILIFPPKSLFTWFGYLIVTILLFILLPLTWSQYIWTRYKKHSNKDGDFEQINYTQPENKLMKILNTCANFIVFNTIIRIFIFISICALMMSCSIIELKNNTFCVTNSTLHTFMTISSKTDCMKPWHMTQTVSLIIFSTFLFIRISHFLKLLASVAITVSYSVVIWNYSYENFKYSETWNLNLQPQIAHILNISFVTLTLIILDRRHEYMNHLDYQWKMRLTKEIDEAAATDKINAMLLYNILPIHVAKIYMNPGREGSSYYEEYNAVSVMFASLTGYTLGVDDDTEEAELIMLGVLNHIICDFDRLLMEHPDTEVEKIKMAGWTYMAACGLEPGKIDSQINLNSNIENSVVVTLVKLAVKFMKALSNYNRETQQNFKLRIGLSHGKVSAGVVGAKKPLYDIWGDTVNMASRMDSTGIPNKIQVTSETARILESQNIPCDLRGNIFVKGKNMVKTYFVKLNEQFDFVPTNENN